MAREPRAHKRLGFRRSEEWARRQQTPACGHPCVGTGSSGDVDPFRCNTTEVIQVPGRLWISSVDLTEVVVAPAPAMAAAAGSDIGATFARTGKRVTRNGAATILEMAGSAGIVMEFGCRVGNCGACATALRRGEVAHVSPPGADVARRSCLACVGTPRAELAIDA